MALGEHIAFPFSDKFLDGKLTEEDQVFFEKAATFELLLVTPAPSDKLYTVWVAGPRCSKQHGHLQ